MKRIITLVLAGMVSAVLAGCHASADVGNPDDTSGTDMHYKKTTTVDENGNKTTHIETQSNP